MVCRIANIPFPKYESRAVRTRGRNLLYMYCVCICLAGRMPNSGNTRVLRCQEQLEKAFAIIRSTHDVLKSLRHRLQASCECRDESTRWLLLHFARAHRVTMLRSDAHGRTLYTDALLRHVGTDDKNSVARQECAASNWRGQLLACFHRKSTCNIR